MEMRVEGAAWGGGTRERIAWLAGLCSLSAAEEQVVAVLMAGAHASTVQALVARLGDEAVKAALAEQGGLRAWGVVRVDGEVVAVNRRIARFLLG
jgi:hypothetical protein